MLHREHILEMLESWKKNTKVKLDIAYYGCDSPLSLQLMLLSSYDALTRVSKLVKQKKSREKTKSDILVPKEKAVNRRYNLI